MKTSRKNHAVKRPRIGQCEQPVFLCSVRTTAVLDMAVPKKHVLAIIDADGLHESGKNKISDMLYHECDYCWSYGLTSDIKCGDGRECVCDECTEEANS